MEFRENDTDSKEISMEKDSIIIPIYYKNEKYIINIHPSKNNVNIVFKLEKEKAQTYYFFEKFDLRDFKIKNKIFLNGKDINDIFLQLKNITKTYFINLEIKGIKINILFKNTNTNAVFKFPLKKKIFSQNKLNPLLEEQISDNKVKLNALRKQIIKLDKSLKIKNDLINSIKTNLSNINNTLNNISIININNNSTINSSSTKNSSSNESNSENNSNNNNEDEYQESINEQDIGHFCPNTKKDINKKKEEKNNKKLINNDNNSDNILDTFFCFENNDPSQNKKIIEFLIILNVITIIIVLYLLGSIYTFKTNSENDNYNEDYEDALNNRYAYISFINNNRNDNNQNFMDLFQEDLQNKGDDGITNSAGKDDYIDKNKNKKKTSDKYLYYTNNIY